MSNPETSPDRDALIDRIHTANVAIATRMATVKEVFEAPLIKSTLKGSEVAQALSRAYKQFQFSVGFINGDQMVFATPLDLTYKSSQSDRELKKTVEEAERDAKDIGALYPTYIEVAAYARGFEAAYRMLGDELTIIKRDLETIKHRLESGGAGPFPFFGRPNWY